MKKVRIVNNEVVDDKGILECPQCKSIFPCRDRCAWFNIIEIAGVKRITCHGVEVAELVEDEE